MGDLDYPSKDLGVGARFATVFIVACALMQGVGSGLLTDHLTVNGSLLLSFIAFSGATVVFAVLDHTVKRSSSRPPMARAARRLMVGMNVATAVTFLSFYTAVALIPAGTASLIELGIVPVVVLAIVARVDGIRASRSELIVGTAVLALALLGAKISWSAGKDNGTLALVAGTALAVCTGLGSSSIVVISRRFARYGVRPLTVNAHRYHIAYIAAGLALIVHNGFTDISGSNVTFLAFVAVISVVLPIYLLQIGLQNTGGFRASIILSCTPFITYFVSIARGQRFQISFLIVMVVGLGLPFAATSFRRKADDH